MKISQELPHASKVFASELMHGAPHLPKEYLEELNAQAQRNIACLQSWIDRGQLAPVDPHHLLFTIWAATQTYADFDWQISMVTGKEQPERCGFRGGHRDHHSPGAAWNGAGQRQRAEGAGAFAAALDLSVFNRCSMGIASLHPSYWHPGNA